MELLKTYMWSKDTEKIDITKHITPFIFSKNTYKNKDIFSNQYENYNLFFEYKLTSGNKYWYYGNVGKSEDVFVVPDIIKNQINENMFIYFDNMKI